MTAPSPYHIRISSDEMDDFMAGRNEPTERTATPPLRSQPRQATAEADRWPVWGVIPGLNAFGPHATESSGRRWPWLLPLAAGLLLLALGARSLAGRAQEAAPPPPLAVPVVSVPPVAAPTTTPSPVTEWAARTSMTVYCDGEARVLVGTRATIALRAAIPDWSRRCFAEYGWCEACQVAWMDAHP